MKEGDFDRGGNGPPNCFVKKYQCVYIYIYIYISINVILFYKITFSPLNNIIESFKSNTITTNFSTIFLQIVEVINFYWFAFGLICNSSIFLILKGIKNL